MLRSSVLVPFRCAAAIWGAVLLFAATAHAQVEGRRYALVIGNDAYLVRPLRNAVNDARLMKSALEAANFTVLYKENAKKADIDELVADLAAQLGPEDTALFYYAGHGVQIANANFLVPVDFEPGPTVIQSKARCFPFDTVVNTLKQARHKRSIFVLDACRSNPLPDNQVAQAGLAIPPEPGPDSLVIYSTNANNTASDSPDSRNSVFTEALAELISQKPALLSDVTNSVTRRVLAATDNKQNPMIYGSPTTKFYFHPPSNLDAEVDPTQVEKWMDDARLREQHEDWQQAIDLVNQVLKKKPGGTLETVARMKLPYLTARRDAQAKWGSNDFAGAAAAYAEALRKDPFSTDAAVQAAISEMLNDRLDEAVKLLHEVRVRGTSESTEKANRMLKELAAVSPAAGQELQAGVPPPPAVEELFSGIHFGIPDFDAGKRFVLATPVDLNRWSKQVIAAAGSVAPAPVTSGAAVAPPATTAATAAIAAPTTASIPAGLLHLELVATSNARDILIRRTADKINTPQVRRPQGVPVKVITDPPGANLTIESDPEQRCASPCVLMLPPSQQTIHAELAGFTTASRTLTVSSGGDEVQIRLEQEVGFVQVEGPPGDMPVIYEGQVLAASVPANLKLPVGKYSVRQVKDGKVLGEQEVDVRPLAPVKLRVGN